MQATAEALPAVASSALPAEIIEKVVVSGDLSRLTSEERVSYYGRTCESLGLNPLTKPFEYIVLNNKLTLYAKRDATDQLRAIRRVSVTIAAREQVGDVYAVTARATTPDGRVDESVGAVSVAYLKGDALANALMKAETKAKRRVTLSIVGLGWLDESEVDGIPASARGAIGELHDTQPIGLSDPMPGDDDGSDADDSLPGEVPPVKRELYEALANWAPEKRDSVLRHYSAFVDRSGTEKSINSVEYMLSAKCSDKWVGSTLAKVREAIERLARRDENEHEPDGFGASA